MPEVYLFGDSTSQGIVLDENNQYKVSRAGCIRLLRRKGTLKILLKTLFHDHIYYLNERLI